MRADAALAAEQLQAIGGAAVAIFGGAAAYKQSQTKGVVTPVKKAAPKKAAPKKAPAKNPSGWGLQTRRKRAVVPHDYKTVQLQAGFCGV